MGLKRLSPGEVAREAYPWFVGSLAVMLATGILLFVSEAMKCYLTPVFWTKMTFLAGAIAFNFTVRHPRRLTKVNAGSLGGRLVAVVSILLWSGVGLAGRFIGFY